MEGEHFCDLESPLTTTLPINEEICEQLLYYFQTKKTSMRAICWSNTQRKKNIIMEGGCNLYCIK